MTTHHPNSLYTQLCSWLAQPLKNCSYGPDMDQQSYLMFHELRVEASVINTSTVRWYIQKLILIPSPPFLDFKLTSCLLTTSKCNNKFSSFSVIEQVSLENHISHNQLAKHLWPWTFNWKAIVHKLTNGHVAIWGNLLFFVKLFHSRVNH